MTRPSMSLTPENWVYITLSFRGDSCSRMLKRRPKFINIKTFYAAQLITVEKSRFRFPQKPRMYVNDCVTSHRSRLSVCIYVRKYLHREE